ncbi:MAG: hypothetical protein EB120_10700, partial [Proteobacteria bacterium]|nr:hypothetical protein [Pseudomonadota bacterium]
MHAGIINAGGFLIVRLSPIVSHASFALHVLFAVGAVTAFFGGLIYLVQTDIKRSLAFSTIGQMGYMMMQCGLGAFSAAVLHVVMHGFYKANAFLSAAGNIDHSPFIPKTGGESKKLPPLSKFPAALISMALLVGSVVLMKVDLAQKPGGFFLAIFLWVASTQFIGTALSVKGSFKSISSLSMLTFLGMCVYWTALDGIGAFLAPVLDPEGLEPMVTELSPVLVTIVGFIFVIAYLLVEVA